MIKTPQNKDLTNSWKISEAQIINKITKIGKIKKSKKNKRQRKKRQK